MAAEGPATRLSGPRPNFFLIGAARSGTTSLASYLAHHPDVFFCDPKEPRFFTDEAWYAGGPDEYLRLFAAAGGAQAVGEGSVSYTMRSDGPWPVPERVARFAPDARLIYLVRHPVDRTRSDYRMNVREGRHGLTLSRAVRAPSERNHLLLRSMYWFQISPWRQWFDDDRICVLFFEDLRRDPAAVTRHCLEFLGVDPDRMGPTAYGVHNRTRPRLARLAKWLAARRGLSRMVRRVLPPEKRRALGFDAIATPDETWTPETLSWFLKQVRPDAEQFLRWAGRSPDFWDLQPPSDKDASLAAADSFSPQQST